MVYLFTFSQPLLSDTDIECSLNLLFFTFTRKLICFIISPRDMILVASATSAESVVLGRNPDNKSVWERWNLEDTGRAEVPLTDDYVDTFPSGMAVDFTSQLQIPMGVLNYDQ